MKLSQVEIVETLELLKDQKEALESLYARTEEAKYSIALKATESLANALSRQLLRIAVKRQQEKAS